MPSATVITGSAGGALGGNGGAYFGSGITALTHSIGKLFSPNLEGWVRACEEDKQLKTLHKQEYHELHQKGLQKSEALAKFKQKSRDAANAAFVRRQQQLAMTMVDDRKREKKARMEGLEKPTLGDPMLGTATNRKRLEDMSVLSEEAVAMWIMPTEKRVGDHNMVLEGIGTEHEDAMRTLPQNASKETVDAFVKNIVGNSHKLTREAVATRKHKDAEKDRLLDLERQEREAAAEARRLEIQKKASDAEQARRALAQKIKNEMAEETRKIKKLEEDRAKKRHERGLAQRNENLERLKRAETDKLRSEAEIANERREGSKMSEGGKGEFLAAMRSGASHEE